MIFCQNAGSVFRNGLEHVPAGVVDQDVDRSCGGDGLLHRFVVRDVDARVALQVEHDNARALGLESLDDGGADAGGAAGDDGGLAFQSSHVLSVGMTAVASSSILPGASSRSETKIIVITG